MGERSIFVPVSLKALSVQLRSISEALIADAPSALGALGAEVIARLLTVPVTRFPLMPEAATRPRK